MTTAIQKFYGLLEQETFLTNVRAFLETRYCIENPDTERLDPDCSQPPQPDDAPDVIFLRLFYKDSDEDQEYEVIYYGPADGTGKFRDALVHTSECCGASCYAYGCPLFEDSEAEDQDTEDQDTEDQDTEDQEDE